MNNVIYIVSKNVSLAEEEAIKKVFGYAGIGPELVKSCRRKLGLF